MGKVTRSPSTTPSINSSELGTKVHGDVVFYYGVGGKKEPSLATVEDRVGHLCQIRLSDKHRGTILRAITSIVHFYRAHGHSMKYLHTDRETVLISCETDLLSIGVIMERTGTDRHASGIQGSSACHACLLAIQATSSFVSLSPRRCGWLSQQCNQ